MVTLLFTEFCILVYDVKYRTLLKKNSEEYFFDVIAIQNYLYVIGTHIKRQYDTLV